MDFLGFLRRAISTGGEYIISCNLQHPYPYFGTGCSATLGQGVNSGGLIYFLCLMGSFFMSNSCKSNTVKLIRASLGEKTDFVAC